MKKLVILCVLLLLIGVVFLVTGCEPEPVENDVVNDNEVDNDIDFVGPKLPGEVEGARRVYDPDDLYLYVGCMWGLEFFYAHIEGWEFAGDYFGVTTEVMGPSEYDVPAMVSAFEAAIAREPAGIITFAVEPEIIHVIDMAIDAGIPVLTVVGDQPDSKRHTFIGTHQYEAGYFGGMNLAGILDEGEVGVLTILGVTMFDEREQGYVDAMEKYSNGRLEVVASGDTKADLPTGITVAKSILAANPDLDAFVCTDSVGAISAATAIREAGLEGEVMIIGMDRNRDVLQEIEEGVITASVAQNDALMPFLGLSLLFNYNYNNIPITRDNIAAGVTTLPDSIFTGQIWVDENNYEYFIMD